MTMTAPPEPGARAGSNGAPDDACGGVAAQLEVLDSDLAKLAVGLVPERIAGHDLARVVRALGRIERRAAGARLVLTKAAADVGAWRAAGCRSPEEWAARQNGTTVGDARGDLEASERLADLPAAREAAVSGEVSAQATKAVAEGAAADPTVERDLVAKARRGDLAEVRDGARRARTRADERDGRVAQRMHARRGLRAWVELDGEGRGTWNVPPAYQAVFLAALEPYRREAFRLAREAGRRESPEALMADALHMLATDVLEDLGLDRPDMDGPSADTDTEPADTEPADTEPADTEPADTDEDTVVSATTEPGAAHAADPASGPAVLPNRAHRRLAERPRKGGNRRAPNQVIVHVDYEALVRGHAGSTEMCEIAGLGPIPVTLARFMTTDAVLRVLVTGTAADVTVIASNRRYVPAPLRAAVEARDRTCVISGCHLAHHLEIDHVNTPFGQGGLTELANLARLCRFHHALKTYAGWTLAGGPGAWDFRPP